MSLSDIEKAVEQKVQSAREHAIACAKLINDGNLAGALEYCRSLGIDPPQCSLTAQSRNADNLRAKAKRMLGEVDWWVKRLKSQALMEYEHSLRVKGQLPNHISDEGLEYDKKYSRRR
ncbi:hypothetical protein CMO91_00485 [Candidatus Woesearchaeota archaeon]|nr:hypothetical protein [Candidatus Woesearchaeota archaeon]